MSSGIDGRKWTEEQERQIDLNVAAALGTVTGKAVMDYLRALTTNAVLPPEATDAEIRYREGMRFVTYLLTQRIERGHREKANGDRSSNSTKRKRTGGSA